jgi:hypothetical protein
MTDARANTVTTEMLPVEAELMLPLWYASPKYAYDALRVPDLERTPEQKARLLLYPPPDVPSFVGAYLDAEARRHDAREEVIRLRAVRGRLEAEYAATDAAATAVDAIASMPRISVEPSRAPGCVTYERVGKRRLCEQLSRDLVACDVPDVASLVERAADAALREPQMLVVAARQVAPTMRIVRYRRRARQRTGAAVSLKPTVAQLCEELHPRTDAERDIVAAVVGRDSTSNPRVAMVAMRAIIRKRTQMCVRVVTAQHSLMQSLDERVVEWLRTLDGRKFELCDGSLRVVVREVLATTLRTSTRVTDAALLRVTSLLFGEGLPVEAIRQVQTSLRLLGGSKRARLD